MLPLTAFLLLTSALTTGCGGATVEDVCNTCKGDSTKVEACTKDGLREQSRAETAGCTGEFQALVDCAVDKSTCSADGDIKTEACDPESDAYEKCLAKK